MSSTHYSPVEYRKLHWSKGYVKTMEKGKEIRLRQCNYLFNNFLKAFCRGLEYYSLQWSYNWFYYRLIGTQSLSKCEERELT